MLLALCTAFMLSQSFRTVAAMMAPSLQDDLHLTPQQLGVFAASFHFAFGCMQLFMGIGIDLWGLRRTILTAFPMALAGAALSAQAPGFGWLVLGQVLIGVGCAPAFLVCTVFIARRFPAHRFAAVSGITLGIGGIGLLLTGTPMAWLVQSYSWRTGFAALAVGCALAWLIVFWRVRETEPTAPTTQTVGSFWTALMGFGQLFRQRHTWGIMAMGAVAYASFITLRGLWLGPLLMQRHGFTLVESGHVALVMSALSLFGPAFFGRLDPKEPTRRRWIVFFSTLMALQFLLMAWSQASVLTVGVAVFMSFMGGYTVLQYADVRSAYPESMTGRALAVFTMAMFLGIALMQWITGSVASMARAAGLDPYAAVLATVAALLVSGAVVFFKLPPPHTPTPR